MSLPRPLLPWLVLACLPVPAAADAAPPTDNPVLAHYAGDPHAADYAWTDRIAWGRVFDLRDFGGVADGNAAGDGVGVTDNGPAFAAAVAAAHAAGGGVVYVPAGTWWFADTIRLRSGVVVRGDAPTVRDAREEGFDPPTRLEFPRYRFDPTADDGRGVDNATAFKRIEVEDDAFAGDLGLVWLSVNRAAIRLASDAEGTERRLVFGVRSNNVASPDPGVPALLRTVDGEARPFQHAWQRHSNRFANNIDVLARRDVLVANNRCNDLHFAVHLGRPGADPGAIDDFRMPGYILQDTKRAFGSDATAFVALEDRHEPVFSYVNHYGIHVRGSSGSVWGAAPFETPSLFRAGVTVRDNWVYTTMRVGYHLSGHGLKVIGNVKEDRPGKAWWLHPTGLQSLQGATTLENRGIDVAGSRILVEGNVVRVFRHRVNNGSYLSTDGEGLLVQECCGGTTLDDVTIVGNRLNAYVGIYKMPYTRDVTVSDNVLEDGAFLMINANKNGTRAPLFDIRVERNRFTGGGGINVTGLSGGGGIFVRDNVLDGGGITFPAGLSTVSGKVGEARLNPIAVGTVRDHPIAVLEDPSVDGLLPPGPVELRVRVTGRFLVPTPASVGDLPALARVEIFADRMPVAVLTTGEVDPAGPALVYRATWFPAPGAYQLSARVVPADYVGPDAGTGWFTVTQPVHVRAGAGGPRFADWRAAHLGGGGGAPEADADADGIPDLLEYALGSDPMVRGSGRLPAAENLPGGVRLRFALRNRLDENVRVILQRSADLVAWTDAPRESLRGVVAEPGTDGTTTFEHVPESPGHWRLLVRRRP